MPIVTVPDTLPPMALVPVTIPTVPVASAPRLAFSENDRAVIDFSNANDGYVMARFHAVSERQLRLIVTTPNDMQYTYALVPGDGYEVFPLTGGNGMYTVDVREQGDDTLFSLVVTATIDVVLVNEFAPFLRPSKYINYSQEGEIVRKAAELTAGIDSQLDRIGAIYNFVISNVSYDDDLAENVQRGYVPDVESILESGKGICFDYAAILTAMLRSQGIPTKLVIGYFQDDDYHAWVSVYAEESGWIDDIVFFDGSNWKLIDPTIAASGISASEIMDYINDETNYNATFHH